MSQPSYHTYPGYAVGLSEGFGYSQSVRVGERIEASGQGGWDRETGKIPEDPLEEINQAFSNLDVALKDAGGKGLSQVYRLNAYLTDMDRFLEPAGEAMKKWFPNHRPLLTAVGVASLALPGMHVEIEGVALDPEGPKTKEA
ncbi:endoribonuclease L-PSP [Magnaporthiopsis poae ATCC 64411]|uniref:Endoribonuclease L-PSP n=1 Tax=Magnaporthiopsis poae (strain ATCC 64411 / 73-15) TaxID=644358 RepID=A0A0C4DSP9_MAGP6|nr:endoribonuclease L-PSP [Magnaporthiopsis poae ATCC 64411]